MGEYQQREIVRLRADRIVLEQQIAALRTERDEADESGYKLKQQLAALRVKADDHERIRVRNLALDKYEKRLLEGKDLLLEGLAEIERLKVEKMRDGNFRELEALRAKVARAERELDSISWGEVDPVTRQAWENARIALRADSDG